MKPSEFKTWAMPAAFSLVVGLLTANLVVQLQILARTPPRPPTWAEFAAAPRADRVGLIMRSPYTRVTVTGEVEVTGEVDVGHVYGDVQVIGVVDVGSVYDPVSVY